MGPFYFAPKTYRLVKYAMVCIVLVVMWWGCMDTQSDPLPPKTTAFAEYPVNKDYDEIVQRGKLVLLTENSSISYYLYRAQPLGFDYEMVHAFAKAHNLELEVVLLEDMNDMFDLLLSGKGDVIACNLTVTDERKKFLHFTHPVTESRQVLIQRKPDGWRQMRKHELEDSLIRKLEDLNGKEIYVHQYSSFYSNLQRIQDSLNIDMDVIEASGNVDSEHLVRLVAQGQIPYTVADENMALLNATYYPNLDVRTALSDIEYIAWAVRPNSDSLLAVMNNWLEKAAIQRKLAYTHRKYFVAKKDQHRRIKSPYSSFAGKRISEYDHSIQFYSKQINWDWKLLAAMIYEESRFNPDARSWVGAFGLMQLMPATGERFGIDTSMTREANIAAGVKYIKFLEKFWEDKVADKDERLKFILASYNVGPGHVRDAQCLAEELGKNPQVWEGNVADCLVLKSQSQYFTKDCVKHGYCRGKEPFNYVKNVLRNYHHYQTLEL